VYGEYFDLFEFWSVMFFTLEYVLRFWATGATYSDHGQKWRGRREYMFGFYGVVDLLAILPFYLQMLFPGADMRALRILRLVRVLKLSHYNSALEDLFNAVKNEARSFIAALYLLTIAIILTSSLMYYAEGDTQPEHFSSIPASMYWAIITLTTVGFGDISPVTWIGQVLATITAFIGVCTVAMLTGIVASSFATQMARRRVVYESQLREAYKDGILSDEEKKMLLKLRTDFNLSEEQIKSINQQVEDEIKQSK
jgi:voltage-gated potassium channel